MNMNLYCMCMKDIQELNEDMKYSFILKHLPYPTNMNRMFLIIRCSHVFILYSMVYTFAYSLDSQKKGRRLSAFCYSFRFSVLYFYFSFFKNHFLLVF